MVHLDVVQSDGAVGVREVEVAHLALDSCTEVFRLCDLPPPEGWVPLAKDRPSREQSSLSRRVAIGIDLVRLWGDLDQLS